MFYITLRVVICCIHLSKMLIYLKRENFTKRKVYQNKPVSKSSLSKFKLLRSMMSY